MNNTIREEAQAVEEVLRRGAAKMSNGLPIGRAAKFLERSSPSVHKRPDGVMQITSPDLERAKLLVTANNADGIDKVTC